MWKSISSSTRKLAMGVISLMLIGAVTGAKVFTPMFTELASFSIGGYSITAGSSTSGVATVTSLVRGVTPVVRFTSSNPAVASVPALKAASSTGIASISVAGASAGCAKITASYNGKVRTDEIVVHPASSGALFTMTVPNTNLVFPGSNRASLNMGIQATGISAPGTETTLTVKPAIWTLTSSNPAVATVPPSVTQTLSSTPFVITGVGDGCAIITARTGGQSVSKTVRVIFVGG